MNFIEMKGVFKVKSIRGESLDDLENKINSFLCGYPQINVQSICSVTGSFAVLILYKVS
jgi:hypothetical protein